MGLTSMCRFTYGICYVFWRWLVTIEKDDVSTNWLQNSSLSLVYGSYRHVPFSYCIVSYGIALFNMVLHCILWYLMVVTYNLLWLCLVLHCTSWYWMLLHCIIQYCTVLHSIAWYCMILFGIALHRVVLYCILWYHIVLYNMVFTSYCIV